MAKPEFHQKTEVEDSSSLKGTLASVGILGLIILITWFSAFNLFLDRQ
ncbi:cytochrome c oxidase subunit 2A [Calidifontibacillus erzurumensis]|uniref:Cytochrome c oxidase subunit 2A n=1 Tax=Calidifontibacillus erzurumensis TaxID=2741433 RepID=A0A8J8KC45_9BACI|nr:cytochrome c oxidase subunit 2A [Calidifontibacillus erzurumensis]NSL52659.1 cytochrome c oxidase subunit 2A [Calidifontibacillus erzurumensis]